MRDTFVLVQMNSICSTRSPGLAELAAFGEAMTWPATDHDRRTFEALFRCVSAELSAPEKGEAERLARLLFTDINSHSITCDFSR